MGVFTPKRAVVFAVAVLVGMHAAANNPSPRTHARMAWDPEHHVGVMFGGIGPTDRGGTQLEHDSAETWLWTGTSWAQRFPATVPPARGVHGMVYDSARKRVVMFGGQQPRADLDLPPTYLNDTWVYENDNWTRIESAENPSVRQFPAMAYDIARDRVVLYGGNVLAEDQESFTARFDTWQFDGAQWTRLHEDGPRVAKPILGYDAGRRQLILIGLNETGTERLMFRFNPETEAWDAVTPATLPTCVNDGHLVYRQHTGKLLFFGGVCARDTPSFEEGFEWDGTTWTKVTQNAEQFNRLAGQAVAYDPLRRDTVAYGGTSAFGAVVGSHTFVLRENTWFGIAGDRKPVPRSKSGFVTDPSSNTIWMFGGLDETSSFYHTDLWGYRNGQWWQASLSPSTCDSPLTAWDSDRSRLVLSCTGRDTYEWSGTEWKSYTDLDDEPDLRTFAAMVYDPKLKKTVLFGGFFDNNFRNDTWLWDGTRWTELDVDSDERPPKRGQHAMWYDPLQQRVILYAGIGRENLNQRVTRYTDMWAFTGTGWTKLDVTETPGMRFGPQVGVNPVSGKVLLFGGLRATPRPDDPTGEKLMQFFDNDTWEWDGAANRWTRLETDLSTAEPDIRENGSMAWDPVAQQLVLFAGYAEGFYRSDVWRWNGSDWIPLIESGSRRRAVR